MKVLHVLDHSLPLHSGYVFRTQGILTELRANGVETCHVTSGKHPAVQEPLETVEGHTFYRTTLRRTPLERIPGANQWEVIRSLRERLRTVIDAEQPDLIHCHSPCLNALAALPIARQRGIPLVYELRASWEDAAVSHGTTREGSLRYRASRMLESYALKHADRVVTICEGLKQDCLARGIAAGKIHVVPNAVDRSLLELLEATPAQSRPAGKVLGFFGSFYAYEGLDTLVHAMEQLKSSHPDARLLLLGSGPQHDALSDLVRSKGLTDQISFLGRVPHEQIADFYRQVDVFVFPRQPLRLTEIVTPLKPLEAMAAGALVVASDVGGHRELVAHERTGLLYPAADVAALAATLDTVLGDPARYDGIRRCGREFVLRERTWPAVATRYLTLYREMLG